MTNEDKAQTIIGSFCNRKNCLECGGSLSVENGCVEFQRIMEMAEWKDKEFWSLDNIEKIIVTYKSFPDRSCPHELVRKTIEKLKPENTK